MNKGWMIVEDTAVIVKIHVYQWTYMWTKEWNERSKILKLMNASIFWVFTIGMNSFYETVLSLGNFTIVAKFMLRGATVPFPQPLCLIQEWSIFENVYVTIFERLYLFHV